MFVEPRDPLVNVRGLLEASEGERAATLAVVGRVGQQHRVAVFEKHESVAEHAFSVVGNAVREQHCAAIELAWPYIPRFQTCGIGSANADVLKVSLVLALYQSGKLIAMPQRTMDQPQAAFRHRNSCQHGENQIDAHYKAADFQQLLESAHTSGYVTGSSPVPYLAVARAV